MEADDGGGDDDEAAFARRAKAHVAHAEAVAARGGAGPEAPAPFPGVEFEGAPHPEANAEGVAADPTGGLFDTIAKVFQASRKPFAPPACPSQLDSRCTCLLYGSPKYDMSAFYFEAFRTTVLLRVVRTLVCSCWSL